MTARHPIEEVWEGMSVVDARGEQVGEVESVRMGNPEAATGVGPESPQPIFNIGSDPDVPPAKRRQLERYGYIAVAGSGLLHGDRYVRADQIERVEQETVVLNIAKDELPREL